MCCFTQPVEVFGTQIFARRVEDQQYLVYSMEFSSKENVAMVLPLPTPAKTPEDGVTFIDLRGYTLFFADLEKMFEAKRELAKGGLGGLGGFGGEEEKPKLAVVQVGAFEASFVPRVADFDRLDERYRLPQDTWKKLPGAEEFGFAVFKLKAGHAHAHPMAFRFPTALKSATFFPTVHIHDGEVHTEAEFDHVLYAQLSVDQAMHADGWTESDGLASGHINARRAGSLVDRRGHVYRKAIKGKWKNEDILV